METLNKTIELIFKNYGINFVIEKITFDETTVAFRLKRKREIKIPFLNKTKTLFDYEMNETNNRINFKNFSEIESYLRLAFSEPEGFITEIVDM